MIAPLSTTYCMTSVILLLRDYVQRWAEAACPEFGYSIQSAWSASSGPWSPIENDRKDCNHAEDWLHWTRHHGCAHGRKPHQGGPRGHGLRTLVGFDRAPGAGRREAGQQRPGGRERGGRG